jgi:hypothetical protein
MKISDLIPEAKNLTKFGFRQRKKTMAEVFRLKAPRSQRHTPDPPIKPDVDYHPEEERKPQAPNFTGMWQDEFRNIGNIRNPLASPMESGA